MNRGSEAFIDVDKKYLPIEINNHISDILNQQFEFYGKSPEEQKKGISFDHIFGKNFINTPKIDLEKTKALSNPEFVDDMKKNLNVFVNSNIAFNELKEQAVEFQKNYGNLVDNHKKCLDNLVSKKDKISNEYWTKNIDNEKFDRLKKEREDLNQQQNKLLNDKSDRERDNRIKLDQIQMKIMDHYRCLSIIG